MKTALITGITGQDGSYLAEFLLEKGYDVHGTIRRSSVDFRERIAHLEGTPHFHLHYADLGDSMSVLGVIGKVSPDEIYNLAAQSHVQVSFDSPEFTADVDAVGVLRILEAVRQLGMTDTCRIYQASTSELYGKVEEVPQNENTPFHPYSPYAVAKQYGFWIVKEYREAYNMYCCSGILFNHESERRGETFVTRKITLAAARISQGVQDCLYLGNMDSLRDWGYAKDYVECMWLILQQEKPEDFVIATGVQHSVREFTQLAFKHAGIELKFEGEGVNEKGICVAGPENLIGKTLVAVSEDFYRPTDVVNLWGDPTKVKAKLKWNPNKTCKILAWYGIEDNKVTLWGTGTPLREFLWSEDMADASVHVLLNVDFKDIIGIEKYSSVHYGVAADGVVDRNHSTGRGGYIPSLGEIRNCHINVGTGKELTIRELSELVVKAVGFEGTVEFDASKPDGTMRKLIDVSKLHSLGWTHKVEIEDGVQKLFEWYKESLH